MKHYLEGLMRAFDCNKGMFVQEDPDELGYFFTRGGVVPAAFQRTVATEETKRILLQAMPEDQWREIERKAMSNE